MRKPNRSRTIDLVQNDRGKKHFWTNKRGDYGFVSNFDLYRFDQDNFYQRSRRHSTLNYQYQQFDDDNKLTYQKWLQISKQKGEILANRKRELELNNGSIQIKLPSIRKKHQQIVKAFSYEINKNTQSYQNIDLSFSRRKQTDNNQASNQAIPQDRPSINSKASQHKRVMTEGNNRQYIISQRPKRNAKYSPTYVCSYVNPLPTFKLYDQGTNNARYQYGFTEQ